METSILFLLHGGKLRTAKSRSGSAALKPRRRARSKSQLRELASGEKVDTPAGLAEVDALGARTFMAALWSLEQEGAVTLSVGKPKKRFRGGISVSVHWTELPIEVSLAEGQDPGGRTSTEGRILSALGGGSGGAGATDLSKLAGTVAAAGIGERAHARLVNVVRDAALTEGVLKRCGPDDPGAVMMGSDHAAGSILSEFMRTFRQFTGKATNPIYVTADYERLGELTREYDRLSKAYSAYLKKNRHFEKLLINKWRASPTGSSGGDGGTAY